MRKNPFVKEHLKNDFFIPGVIEFVAPGAGLDKSSSQSSEKSLMNKHLQCHPEEQKK